MLDGTVVYVREDGNRQKKNGDGVNYTLKSTDLGHSESVALSLHVLSIDCPGKTPGTVSDALPVAIVVCPGCSV